MTPESVPPPLQVKKHSALGILSFVFGLISFVVLLFLFYFDIKFSGNTPYFWIFISCTGYFIVVLFIVGLILSIIGLTKKNSKRLFQLLGLILCCLDLTLAIIFYFIPLPSNLLVGIQNQRKQTSSGPYEENLTPSATEKSIGKDFFDDFSDSYSDWVVEDESVKIVEGKLVIDTTRRQWITLKPRGTYENTRIDVDVELNSEGNAFVFCRQEGVYEEEVWYFAMVTFQGESGEGQYSFGYQEENVPNSFNHEYNEQIQTLISPSKTNHLTLICDGDRISFFVNGEKIAEVQDDKFKEGQVGIGAWSTIYNPTTILFDNFIITTLP